MEEILNSDQINDLKIYIYNLINDFVRDFTGKSTKEVLSRKEACSFLGVSLKTLSNYMDQGKIEAKKVNGRVFLLKRDLLEVLSKSSR